MLHTSGSGNGVGSQLKVPDESQDKTTGTNEGTGTKPRVPDVPKDQSESKNESWGDSRDDDSNDDGSDDVSNDDDDVDSDADGDNDASDSERTDSDEDENPTLNLKNDEEEEYEEEYVHTPENYEFTDDEDEYEELYKDVNMRLKDAEHEKEGKGDANMTDAGLEYVSQEKSYEQVKDDAHVTLIAAPVTQKTESPMQSSSVSSDFANQFLNLDNASPTDNEVVSMMNVKVRHEEPSTQTPSILTIPVTVILKTSTAVAPTIPSIIQQITPLPQQSTPTLAPTTEPTTTSIPALPDFSSLFRFDQRVFVLEKELSQLKQKAFRSYTAEFEKKAQDEKKRYINLIEKSVKEIIKDKFNTQLPQILPKEISDFATPVIQSTITESLENVVLAKSSSQPQSTYEAAASLTEFELKKILLDKMQKNPPAGSDQGLKRRKTRKDAEPSKGSKSKESKSSRSKGTKSQPKSSGKSAQAKEPVFEFKEPERPPTPDPDWNAKKSIDFRPPQTWISKIAQAEKPPLTFDKLMSIPIDFLAYVMNNLKIDNLT
ncbi:hypothetical protein Tco_0407021 [Tanacetum coccineum]